MSNIGEIRMQVMWNRLISVVEEQAQTLLRTAFSTSVRESGDLSAGVFDPTARCWRRPSPARRAMSTPWPRRCCISSPRSRARKCSRATPMSPTIPGRAPGICTTSPWCRRPSSTASWSLLRLHGACRRCRRARLRGGRQVGLRGRHPDPDHEVRRARRRSTDLVRILRVNVREPNQVVGDFFSLAACNEVGHRRLVDMMKEIGLTSLDAARRLHLFAHPRGDAGAHRGAAEGQLVERAGDRRLRRAGQARGESHHHDERRRGRFHRHRSDEPLGHQRARSSIPRPMPAMRSNAWWRRISRTMPPRWPSSPSLRRSTSSTRCARRRWRCATFSATWCPISCSARCRKGAARQDPRRRRRRLVEHPHVGAPGRRPRRPARGSSDVQFRRHGRAPELDGLSATAFPSA
jgi:hypothetical protein